MAPLKETCGSDGNVVGSTARRFRQLKYDDRYDNQYDSQHDDQQYVGRLDLTVHEFNTTKSCLHL